MKMVNVYSYYDESKRVIARIIPSEKHEISERTYKRISKKALKGASIYTDAGYEIYVKYNAGIITIYSK